MLQKTSLRAAIYARYSSDQQSAASIPDQIRLCRRLCEEQGWDVVEAFADEAMSGATHLRPDFQRMQQLAMVGGFDVLVAESLDRLSRDQEHIAGLHKRMGYRGIQIFTKAEGEITELHVGLGGTMSAIFLRQLAQKTHRGLEGRVKAGKSAGGISYGYRLDRQPLPDGTYTTGDRVIDPTEAAIVRRIFTEYDRGRSARAIAIGLNRDGIPAPRSGGKGKGTWSFSTISGNWKRGTGVLNNELYVGKLVWNRQHFIKDPDSGKRQARPNPPDAWVTEDIPALRIIADDLWARVKHRQGAIREDILTERAAEPGAPKIERGHRPRYLLSGFLTCSCCGSGYIMISDSRLGCAAARNSGTCSNRKTIKRTDVETRVLSGLKEKLLHPDLIQEFIAEFQRESQKERLAALSEQTQAERQLAKVVKEIDNIVTAITQGMFHPSMKAKMDGLEAERASLEAKLAALPQAEPIAIHPGLADIYARKVADLVSALNEEGTRAEAADLLRGLIDKIILQPDPDAANGHVIELYGELGAILSLCSDQEAPNAKARSGATGFRQLTLVAGACNHVDRIDPAVTRAGRFDLKFEVPMPDATAILAVLRQHLKADFPTGDLQLLARQAVGHSLASIDAAIRATRSEARHAGKPLDLGMLRDQLRLTPEEEDREVLWRYAVHEAGHTVVSAALRLGTIHRMSISRDGGQVASQPVIGHGVLTEIENQICHDLAGRAAEAMIFGEVSAGAGGSLASDLSQATRRALMIETTWGLGDLGPLWMPTPETVLQTDEKLRARVRARLEAAEARAIAILTAHKVNLLSLAETLLQKRSMRADEILPWVHAVQAHAAQAD